MPYRIRKTGIRNNNARAQHNNRNVQNNIGVRLFNGGAQTPPRLDINENGFATPPRNENPQREHLLNAPLIRNRRLVIDIELPVLPIGRLFEAPLPDNLELINPPNIILPLFTINPWARANALKNAINENSIQANALSLSKQEELIKREIRCMLTCLTIVDLIRENSQIVLLKNGDHGHYALFEANSLIAYIKHSAQFNIPPRHILNLDKYIQLIDVANPNNIIAEDIV